MRAQDDADGLVVGQDGIYRRTGQPRYRGAALERSARRPKLQTFGFKRCNDDFTLKAVVLLRFNREFVLYDPQNHVEAAAKQLNMVLYPARPMVGGVFFEQPSS